MLVNMRVNSSYRLQHLFIFANFNIVNITKNVFVTIVNAL